MQGGNVKIIEKPMLERYFEAERLATNEIYIVCDDDCLPATPTTLKELIEVMENHPDYSQIGLGWKPNMNDEWNNGNRIGQDGDVWEFNQCGGIIAIRKDTIKDLGYLMEYENYGDDKVLGKIARAQGYKVGVTPNLYFHNLGVNHTTFNCK